MIRIRANHNTLHSEVGIIKDGDKEITVEVNEELGQLLGFRGFHRFKSGIRYTSPLTVKISKVNVIRINCNVAKGSYLNGKPSHTIHQFYPNVPPGYRIIEVPYTVIYHTINTNLLHNLTVDITDQEGELVDFRGEEITVRLCLRKQS